jgi:hypothetical protein
MKRKIIKVLDMVAYCRQIQIFFFTNLAFYFKVCENNFEFADFNLQSMIYNLHILISSLYG